MIDVQRLRVLRAVVETGSVSRAAEALGFTPSSVSQQLAALQREVGTPLIERDGRGIRPTPAALVLDRHAGEVFDSLARAESALRDYRSSRRDRVRVEYIGSAGRSLIAPVVASLLQEQPQTQIELSLEPPGDPVERIVTGQSDLALVVTGQQALRSGSVRTPLVEDPFVAVLGADHPLAAQEEVGLDQLADQPWVTHEWPLGPCSGQVLARCTALGFTPQYRVECQDVATALVLIASGTGVGVFPRLTVGPAPEGVAVRPLRSPVPVRQISLIHRGDEPGREAVTTLREALRSRASALADC